MANNRKCILCKKEYNYCPNCNKDRNKPTWYRLYCSQACHDIFDILNNYNFKLITKEEAKMLLSKCDLSIVSELNDHYRAEIESLMAEPKKKKEIPTIENPVEQTND